MKTQEITAQETFKFSDSSTQEAFVQVICDYHEHRPELLERLITNCWEIVKNDYSSIIYQADWNEVLENLKLFVKLKKASIEAEHQRRGTYNHLGVY